MIIAKQSTARIVTVGPIMDASGVAVTDGVVGDLKISKNGGAPAALNGSATLTHRHTGHYSLSLTTSDLDTVGSAEVVIDDTVNAMPIRSITVIEEAVYDAFYAASATGLIPVNVTQFGGSNGTFSGGRPEVNTTHAAGTAWGSGAITAASIANGAIDAATFAADVDAEILSYIVDDDTRIDASALNTASVTTVPGINTKLGTPTDFGSGTSTIAANLQDLADDGTATYDRSTDSLQAIKDNAVTTAALVDAIWDEATSGHATAGTTGKALTDILADTNELQTDLVNGGRLDLLIDGIKAKTDSLTFTVANNVDANIQYVNDTAITGNGGTGTEWGPA